MKLKLSRQVWPSEFDGLRIGHVSDFHLGDLMPIDRAIQSVELLASQEPDIVVCTGDVVDLYVEGAKPLLKALADVGAPLGTMLVLGNHDELDCANTLGSMALEEGITLLRNATCNIQVGNDQLRIAGIDWAKSAKQCSRMVARVCNEDTHLLLSHNPKAFSQAVEMNIPLTLSGHTHGGQMALKKSKGANLAIAHKYTSGMYEVGDCRLYVTVGVGAWFSSSGELPSRSRVAYDSKQAIIFRTASPR